jgi:hypothetical protein
MRLQKKDLYVFYMADRLCPFFQDAQNIRMVRRICPPVWPDSIITFNGIL